MVCHIVICHHNGVVAPTSFGGWGGGGPGLLCCLRRPPFVVPLSYIPTEAWLVADDRWLI